MTFLSIWAIISVATILFYSFKYLPTQPSGELKKATAELLAKRGYFFDSIELDSPKETRVTYILEFNIEGKTVPCSVSFEKYNDAIVGQKYTVLYCEEDCLVKNIQVS